MQTRLLIKLGRTVISGQELNIEQAEEMIRQRGIGIEKMYFC